MRAQGEEQDVERKTRQDKTRVTKDGYRLSFVLLSSRKPDEDKGERQRPRPRPRQRFGGR